MYEFEKYLEDSHKLKKFILNQDISLEIYCLKDNLPSVAESLHLRNETCCEY